MKILVVEDEIRMAQALCKILRLENYEADHCADGLSGYESALNSFEIGRRLRKRWY